MKILKILKWTGLVVFAAVLSIFLFFIISNKLFLGSTDEHYTAYLKKNKNIISLKPKENIENLLSTSALESDIFLLGEIHGFADVQKVDQALFCYLNKNAGVRYYIAEMDSLRAHKLNRFLSKSTADTTLLKEVVVDIKKRIPQQTSRELYKKWINLYEYNAKLPDSAKMEILGIDRGFDDKTDYGMSRDSLMMKNFRNIIETKNLEKEKFYGFFGLFHVLQSGINNYKTFANRLKQSNFQTKSFVCYTIDSDMYLPKYLDIPTPDDEKASLANADGPLSVVKGITDLKEVTADSSITLFNLEAENSPYFKGQKLVLMKNWIFGADIVPDDNYSNTVDFFQYVFLIRDSEALTPLE